MLYALIDSTRTVASPGAVGQCPQCGGGVIARCGTIYAWHWAHRSAVDCDGWSEPEGRWHLDWKRRFPAQWREVTIENHRADIKAPAGIIELQASPISPDEIEEREEFYGDMVWVVDARNLRFRFRDKGSYVTFRWFSPRKSWWTAERPLYFDLGGRLLRIHKIHPNIPCGGSGTYLSYQEFIDEQSSPRKGEALCEDCRMAFRTDDLVETRLWEYYTLDVDPQTLLCLRCHETRCFAGMPDDPDLVDVMTPVCRAW